MITFKETVSVYVSLSAIDFRKGLDGLLIMIGEVFEKSPQDEHLFLFRDRTGKKLKGVYWDGNGFMMLYKRLEVGKFQFPKIQLGEMHLGRLQLECLLSGMNFTRNNLEKPNKYAVFS